MKRATQAGLLAVIMVFAAAGAARADQYAAIAYSQSTGSISYSYGYCTQADAEENALSNCEGDDARIVTWSKNAYCALALGDKPGAFGGAWGYSQHEAEKRALEICSQYTTGCYIHLCVFSGN